jgi:hypothetical protein
VVGRSDTDAVECERRDAMECQRTSFSSTSFQKYSRSFWRNLHARERKPVGGRSKGKCRFWLSWVVEFWRLRFGGLRDAKLGVLLNLFVECKVFYVCLRSTYEVLVYRRFCSTRAPSIQSFQRLEQSLRTLGHLMKSSVLFCALFFLGEFFSFLPSRRDL